MAAILDTTLVEVTCRRRRTAILDQQKPKVARMSGMLVGMSFLNKLSSYKVENGALHLTR